MLRLATMGLLARWKKFTLPIIILTLSFFFIIYETTMFGIAHARTSSIVKLFPDVDYWVMNENARSLSSTHGIDQQDLFKIKSINGIQAISPLYTSQKEFSSLVKRKIDSTIIGIDINSPFALPKKFLRGRPQNLTYQSGILVDERSNKKLSLKLGSKLRAKSLTSTVVGVFALPKRIGQQSLVITSIDWAKKLSNENSKGFPFLLVKKAPSANHAKVKASIEKTTNLKAFDKSEFSKLILTTIMKETGLPHAFAAVVLCGLILAAGIILTTLYSITEQSHDELMVYKTLGASKTTLVGISLFNAAALVTISLTLALVCNFVLVAIVPSGTFVFVPNKEIVFLISFISFLAAALIAVLRVSTIKTLGAAHV